MAFRDHALTRRKHLDLELYEHFLGIAPKGEERSEQEIVLPTQKYFLLGATDFWTKDLDTITKILMTEEKQLLSGQRRDGKEMTDEERFRIGHRIYAWSATENKACPVTSTDPLADSIVQREYSQGNKISPRECRNREELPRRLVACKAKHSCQYQCGNNIDTGTGYRLFCSE